MPDQDEYLYSPVVAQTATASFAVGSNLTWDSSWRQILRERQQGDPEASERAAQAGQLLDVEAPKAAEAPKVPFVLRGAVPATSDEQRRRMADADPSTFDEVTRRSDRS